MGWIVHYFASENIAVIVGIVVYFMSEIALSIALRYYGLKLPRRKLTVMQHVLALTGWLLVGLLVLEMVKQLHN
ncbi:MAG: hypothetical protein ABIR37_04295 [Candidatus Saccharimonadales bacterium]